MPEAEQQQPAQPARLQRPPFSARPSLFHEQIQAGAEQQREQAAHLAVDQHELRDPHPFLGLAVRHEEGVGIHIGGERLAEGDDIGGENSHHRDAANEVEAGDPVSRHRARHRLVGRSVAASVDRIHAFPLGRP